MTRIGLLTTLWQRHDLERITLRWHSSLDIPGIEIVPLAVGSEGAATRRLAHRAGWHYVEAPNSPLSNKHNAGMRAFQTAGVDGVVVIGSDNLLNAAYFEHAASVLAEGRELLELRGIWFYDAPTDRLAYCSAWSTGVGRMVSSSLMRRRDWIGWIPGRDRYMDRAMTERVVSFANPRAWVGDLRKTDIRVVDIKTDRNMWTYEACVHDICRADRRHPYKLTREWFDRHFPGTYDDIQDVVTSSLTTTPEPQTA